MDKSDSALTSISEQSDWYGQRARHNSAVYRTLKTLQLTLAAAIPVVSVASAGEVQRWITAGLGALIGVLEGVLQLGQYQQNWLIFRATREALKSESRLHLANAGPYAGVLNPDEIFVVRCDAIISGEHSKWLSSQQQADPKK